MSEPMFDPINSDHAIQLVRFSLVFDGPTGDSAGRSLRSNRDLLAELPAIQEPESIQFGVNLAGSGSVTLPQRRKGIQLAHLRPDGSPAWALRVIGNEMAVECSRYTRWEKVWGAALKYLSAALDAVKGANSDRQVQAASLDFVDVFVPNDEEYDLSSLLQQGPLIAGKVFMVGPTWHSHVGWFERIAAFGRDSQLCLNHLNIDAARVAVGQASAEKQLRINITHHQELRVTEALPLPSRGDLENLMNNLHIKNKSILKDLLIPSMAERIGLGTTNASS